MSVEQPRQISLGCPHCKTGKVAFGLLFRHPAGDFINDFLSCGCCGIPIILRYKKSHISKGIPIYFDVFPESISAKAPEGLSDRTQGLYLQGLDSLTRRNWDAAGAMFRKSLEVAVSEIFPEGRGTLAECIKKLPDDRGLTKSMKDWANEIRLLGNGAAHDEFNQKEANLIKEFTEMFLTYAFTMPGKMAARREQVK